MNAKTPHRLLRLDIDPVIQRAEQLAEQVRRDLPSHSGHHPRGSGHRRGGPRGQTRGPRAAPPVGLAPPAGRLCGGRPAAVRRCGSIGTSSTSRRCASPLPKEDAMQLRERLSHAGRVRFENNAHRGLAGKPAVAAEQQGRIWRSSRAGFRCLRICHDFRIPAPEVVLYLVRGMKMEQSARRATDHDFVGGSGQPHCGPGFCPLPVEDQDEPGAIPV